MNRRGFLGRLGAVVASTVIGVGTTLSWNKPLPKVVGFKGDAYLEAGFIYAPYMPLYMTSDVKREFLNRYAEISFNKSLYSSRKITT